jgi:hypothetical protein
MEFEFQARKAFELAEKSGKRNLSLEEYLLREKNICDIYNYARLVIKGRWKKAEELILTDLRLARCYAEYIMGVRWPEAEKILLENDNITEICYYSRGVIKGRWLEAEYLISCAPDHALGYVFDVVKERWPEGETAIRSNPNPDRWKQYLTFIKKIKYSTETKLQWLATEGPTNNLLWVLNHLGMTKKVQEIILQTRPDFVGEMKRLNPKLKIKFANELVLSGIEI